MFFHFVHNGDYIYKLSKIYNVNENKIINDNSLIESIFDIRFDLYP